VQACLRAGADSYGMVLEVSESDHKPVYADLAVVVPAFDQEAQRQLSLAALRAGDGSCRAAEPRVSHTQLALADGGAASVSVGNPHAGCAAAFCVVGEGGGGLPPWLEVVTAAGVVGAGDSVHLQLRAARGVQWGGGGGGRAAQLAVCLVPLGQQGSSSWQREGGQQQARLRVELR